MSSLMQLTIHFVDVCELSATLLQASVLEEGEVCALTFVLGITTRVADNSANWIRIEAHEQ